MHPCPWQLVLAGHQVLVERLGHVPDEADVDVGHQREKILLTGAGGSVHRNARHKISFIRSSSTRSASARSRLALFTAPTAFCGFRSSNGTRGFSATYGLASG